MIAVWKFPLKPYISTLGMPEGAEILRVGAQGSEAFIWARVDTDAKIEVRSFAVVGTGHPAPGSQDGAYVGTFDVTMPGDPILVFHVFEETR